MISEQENYKILDSKKEMIAFIIDINEDIFKEEMCSDSEDKKSVRDRFSIIMTEILNFAKLKKFISNNNNEFSLYVYNTKLVKMIDFSSENIFSNQFEEIRKNKLINMKILEKCVLTTYIKKRIINDDSRLKILSDISSETILRFVFIYNRPSVPKIDNTQVTTYDLIKYTNFFCDFILLRRKIVKEEEKKLCNTIYETLNTQRPKSWYSFEMSGNIQKFKHCMNLLLAHPLQRIKNNEVEKFQRKMEDVFKNFID